MNCNEVRDKLIDYIDESIDGSEEILTQEHLEGCLKCKKELEDLQLSISYLKENGQRILPTANFNVDVVEKNTTKLQKRSKRFSKRITSGVLVAALLTMFVMTAFAVEGFNVLNWWKNRSLKQSESIEELIAKGYGEKLDITVEDQKVRVTLESVVADEVGTLLLLKMEDLEKDIKYEVGSKDNVAIKGNFLFDGHSINAKNDESIFVSSYNLYTPEKNISRTIVKLDPVVSEEEIIDFNIKQLQQLESNGKEVLKGNWNFQIPVKKYKAYTYPINEEMNLDGNIIIFEEIVIAPTMTNLTYRYRESQNNILLKKIDDVRLVANNIEYTSIGYGMHASYNGITGVNRESIRLEPMYFDTPKEVKIKVGGYRVLVKESAELELDLDKPFPQHFEYKGSPITVDAVELGGETARILVTDHMDNREYESLGGLEIWVLNNNFPHHGYSADGFFVDENGKKATYEDIKDNWNSALFLDENKKDFRFYATFYDIVVKKRDFDQVQEVIPYRIDIQGYYETRFTNEEITVRLKENQ